MSTSYNPSNYNPSNDPDRTAISPVRRDLRSGETHREVTSRQKEEFGGMKFGASFFGWLSATGMIALLLALLVSVGAALGIQGIVNLNQVGAQPQAAGMAGGIVLLVVILVAYFCGGYVAGRMARFSGLKQGLGVWLWAIVIAIVLGVLSFIAGAQLGLPAMSGLPQLPVQSGSQTWGAIVVVLAVLVVSLVGALLGGLAGMRYHRRVDRVGHDV